jgi:hypothetical protein
MKLIDRFVSRELLVNVFFAIVVLSLVLVVGNIFRKLLPLLVNHDVPMEYLLTFIAYVLPFHLPRSRLSAPRFACGSTSRWRRPRRKNCGARFLIWLRAIRWRFLAATR